MWVPQATQVLFSHWAGEATSPCWQRSLIRIPGLTAPAALRSSFPQGLCLRLGSTPHLRSARPVQQDVICVVALSLRGHSLSPTDAESEGLLQDTSRCCRSLVCVAAELGIPGPEPILFLLHFVQQRSEQPASLTILVILMAVLESHRASVSCKGLIRSFQR